MVVYTGEGEKESERHAKKGRRVERERYKWVMSRLKRNGVIQ